MTARQSVIRRPDVEAWVRRQDALEERLNEIKRRATAEVGERAQEIVRQKSKRHLKLDAQA
jgi:hypothetical protein